MSELLRTKKLSLATPGGRPLFDSLELSLGHDRVAVIGRNGVGKSTLLDVLAGRAEPAGGTVLRRSAVWLVPQDLSNESAPALSGPARREGQDRGWVPHGGSPGEERKRHLLAAKHAGAEVLLLDEPTDDLDEAGVEWLRGWLQQWAGALVVVSHDERLLVDFEHFFIVAESGCRYVPGTFDSIQAILERERQAGQRQYLSHMHRLAEREWHDTKVSRRRRRKKNLGRLHEEARNPTRAQLHGNKSYAQQSQGKAAKIRQARIEGVRRWVKAARRAMAVDLPLAALMPELSALDASSDIRLTDVAANVDGRVLFDSVGLTVRAGDRVAVVGPNGSGKTTLLEVARGIRQPNGGAVHTTAAVGSIAQGAEDWMLDESLVERLGRSLASADEVAATVVAHRFPLALAERPLRTLSPGERVRAALMCLMHQRPTVTALVLDEPSDSLDFVGAAALAQVLKVWPGGLLIASHDATLLDKLQPTAVIALGRQASHQNGFKV